MKKICVAALLVFTLLNLAGAQSQQLDGIAAIVGDEIILVSDINAMVTQYGFQNKVNVFKNPELFRKLSRQFLQELIDQKLLLIKADEDTIKADQDRVDQNLEQQFKYMVQQAGSEENLQKYMNQTIPQIKRDMRREITNQMRIQILRQKKFGKIKISRREVENFFKQYADSLPQQEPSVDISHILLQVKPSEESVQKAYEKILSIKKQLENGADFAELARKYSEDPGSASKGGDLGFVQRGDLVKPFEEAAFQLKENQISDIVQTQFGFHIIQMIEKRGEKIRVRHILIKLQPTKADEERTIQKLKKIRQDILDGKATWSEMALKYSDDPNVQKDKGHLGKFKIGGFQIKEFEKVTKELKPGEISQPFRTEFGYHIVRLNSREEKRPLSLTKDWQQIEQWALEYKRNNEYKKWIAKLRKEIPIEIKLKG